MFLLCLLRINLFFYCSLSLSLAVYLFHFSSLRASLCWFGLLLFVLFLYWYIMEEFELPWAIVSFITSCSILFCIWVLLCEFVLQCLCVCVCVWGGWFCSCVFIMSNKKKTSLVKTIKGTKWACFFVVFKCKCEIILSISKTLTARSCRLTVTLWNFSQTVPSRFLFVIVYLENVYTYKVRHPKSN